MIPAAERDKGLAEKLKAEWPAILRWAIEGCLAWQRDGLQPPAGVQAATEDYLAGEDIIGQWIADCCEEGPGAAGGAGQAVCELGRVVGAQPRTSAQQPGLLQHPVGTRL